MHNLHKLYYKSIIQTNSKQAPVIDYKFNDHKEQKINLKNLDTLGTLRSVVSSDNEQKIAG